MDASRIIELLGLLGVGIGIYVKMKEAVQELRTLVKMLVDRADKQDARMDRQDDRIIFIERSIPRGDTSDR